FFFLFTKFKHLLNSPLCEILNLKNRHLINSIKTLHNTTVS
ncbi:unnamed protein product, partial [Larinioides sclopetarius]